MNLTNLYVMHWLSISCFYFKLSMNEIYTISMKNFLINENYSLYLERTI